MQNRRTKKDTDDRMNQSEMSLIVSNVDVRFYSKISMKTRRASLSDDDEPWDEDLSTDQQIFRSAVGSLSTFTPYAKEIIEEFHSILIETVRRSNSGSQIEPISKKIRCQIRTDFDGEHLLKNGYAVLSDETFPFYCLCSMCGSLANDLIFCNSCCQAYHSFCLNSRQRPRLRPTPESWLCPNCISCSICGLTSSSSMIVCSDCQKSFHFDCLKSEHRTDDPHWLCPHCLKCDCGQRLKSSEENLFPVKRSLMCNDCVNQLKLHRNPSSHAKMEKCHLCHRCITQLTPKTRPLFSLQLISQQPRQPPMKTHLFQCQLCQHRFHPKCDGYLNEDLLLLPSISSMKIVCSQCDQNGKELLQKTLNNSKIQLVQTIIRSIVSILSIMIADERRLNDLQMDLANLEQLHRSLDHSLNLHAFLNDLLILVQSYLQHLDVSQWQSAIEQCLRQHCPWFRMNFVSSTSNKTILCPSSSVVAPSIGFYPSSCRCPSIDHPYSLTNEHLKSKIQFDQTNLLTSSDSLLNYLRHSNEHSSFVNLHQIDTRMCQLCQTYADQISSRLIPIGLHRWVHLACLLPLYRSTAYQRILSFVNETIERSMKIECNPSIPPESTSAPVYADLNNSFIDVCLDDLRLCIGSLQVHSFGHFGYLIDSQIDSSRKFYPHGYRASRVFWSTKHARQQTVYHLHIAIEQTYHQIESNHRTTVHPIDDQDKYREDMYHLAETFFQQHQRKKSVHHINNDPIAEILSIDTKTLKNFLLQTSVQSSNLSRFALALVQALQHIDQTTAVHIKEEYHEPILSYYPPKSSPCRDELIRRYENYLDSILGQPHFTITSDDGYRIEGNDLDQVWASVVDQVRTCRDDMNLTHLLFNAEVLQGHQMFGLTTPIVKSILQRLYSSTIDDSTSLLLPLTSLNANRPERKNLKRKRTSTSISRLIVYQRKHRQRQRFAWLTHPDRKIEYALQSFEIDEALVYARRILLQEASVSLRLYHLKYFSQRALFVGASSIDGCGLFTLIDLVEGQMIIEYTGEVVRPALTDPRERENEEKGFGCYMFTVDSMNVIDATHQGNRARFINHHCQPNCFAKTVVADDVKHIVIYASIDIPRGSELTYDYSFPEEEIKIPCRCGNGQCRMYLN